MAAPSLVQFLGANVAVSDDESNQVTIDLDDFQNGLDEDNVTAQRLFVSFVNRFLAVQDTEVASQVTVVAAPFTQVLVDGNPATRYRYTIDVNVPGLFSVLSIN